ncbi:MAG: GNAT family N-acetyltransferase [Pseudomonadota bacterium]
MFTVRQLTDLDRLITDQFLEKYSHSCMFMRSNIAQAGLVFRGMRYQGDHFGAFEGDQLIGVMGHYWNGNMMIQMQNTLSTPILSLSEATLNNALMTNRPVKGLLGPSDQVHVLQKQTLLKKEKTQFDNNELLLGLDLKNLIIPELCDDPDYTIRYPVESDREQMIYWRYEFQVETGLSKEDPSVKKQVEADVQEFMTNKKYWLFEYQNNPVGFVGFNAVIEDTVQPGGVWVPPHQRNKSYARAATAMILKLARDEWGKTKSTIFTSNPAAEKAYKALGYEEIGHYAIKILAKPFLPNA